MADSKKNPGCQLWGLLLLSISPWLTALGDTAYNTLTYNNVMSFGISKTAAGVAQVPVNGQLFFYGTLTNASLYSGGAIYRTSSDGVIVETIYQLQETDGFIPQSGLLLGRDNNLYGTTLYGPKVGVNLQAGSGTIFRLGLDGTGYTTLHKFDDLVATTDSVSGFVTATNSDGAFPVDALTDGNDGFLYGVTTRGGVNGTGTIFRVRLDGNSFQVLHSFGKINPTTGYNANYTHEGATPAGTLMFDQVSGFLYGVTKSGGDAGNGTLYRIQADGSQFQTIFSFEQFNGAISGRNDTTNCHGAVPTGRPMLVNDTLYGVTELGGNDSSNCNGNSDGSTTGFGTVYAVAVKDISGSGLMDSSKFVTIHDFAGSDGQSPFGDLVLGRDGLTLYGVTSGGASTSAGAGTSLGEVFSIDLRNLTSGFNVAHAFASNEGQSPTGFLIQGNDGYLYGTATGGGACSGGAVFQLRNDGSTNSGGNISCQNLYAASSNTSNSLYGGGGSFSLTLLGILAFLGIAAGLRRLQKSNQVSLNWILGKMGKI